MSNETKGKLGIVCAICVVLIVVGAVAGWQLYEIFTETSTVAGSPGEVIEGGFELSDDESVFFSYTIDALTFDIDDSGNYTQTIVFEPMSYDATGYEYDFYFNGQRAASAATVGRINARMDYVFYLPDGAEYNAELNVSLTFLNDRTELTLTVADRETTGYLNQMTRSGLTIVVVASPSEGGFELSGSGEIAGVVLDKDHIVF